MIAALPGGQRAVLACVRLLFGTVIYSEVVSVHTAVYELLIKWVLLCSLRFSARNTAACPVAGWLSLRLYNCGVERIVYRPCCGFSQQVAVYFCLACIVQFIFWRSLFLSANMRMATSRLGFIGRVIKDADAICQNWKHGGLLKISCIRCLGTIAGSGYLLRRLLKPGSVKVGYGFCGLNLISVAGGRSVNQHGQYLGGGYLLWCTYATN